METESSNEQAVEKEQEAPSTESTEVKQHEDVNQDKQGRANASAWGLSDWSFWAVK